MGLNGGTNSILLSEGLNLIGANNTAAQQLSLNLLPDLDVSSDNHSSSPSVLSNSNHHRDLLNS